MFTLSVVFAVVCAAVSVVMLTKHGPIPVLHYALLTKEQRKEARCPKEYRNGAIWMGLMALCWVLECLVIRYIPSWTYQFGAIVGVVTVCYLAVYDLRPQDKPYNVPDPDNNPIPKDAIC